MQDKKSEIKAVLFDLGETILNFGKVDVGRLFNKGAASSYKFLKSIGQSVGSFRLYCWRNLIAIRLHYWLSNVTNKDFDALKLLKKTGRKKGYNLNEQQWKHLVWLWYEPLSKFAKVETDIQKTLSKLKEMNLKLGIVSNTFIHQSCLDRHLAQLGLLKFFDFTLYSYEVNFRKPDHRIFEAAAKKIGEIPANILFTGDKIDIDIKPALKAGMKTALKNADTNIGKKLPDAAYKITNLSELPSLIKQINSDIIKQKSPAQTTSDTCL